MNERREHALPQTSVSCDAEPIQFLGRIQPQGFLLEISADWIVTRASENIQEFLHLEPESVIGHPASAILGERTVHDLRGRLQIIGGRESVAYLFGSHTVPDTAALDLAVHRQAGHIIVEGEWHVDVDENLIAQVQPLLTQISSAESNQIHNLLSRHVRALTGFDRVMVYQFQEDETGAVVAEAKRAGLSPYLGLRYPASDIPRQARALYERNLIRIICDVSDETVAVLPRIDPHGRPIDLSMCGLRAVSEIHLEYLRNMGVAASMSISILQSGKLWGLIACHHMTPRVLSMQMRHALAFYGQMASSILQSREQEYERQRRQMISSLHDRMLSQIGFRHSLDDIQAELSSIQQEIRAHGYATCVDGQLRLYGSTPDQAQVLGIINFLNRTAASRIYSQSALSTVYPAAEEFAETGSGILAIPVSRNPRDYMIFFRGELARQVIWAGKPEKIADPDEPARLTPRKSFEAWRELVRNQSEHWSRSEREIAELLRITLLELLLKITDQAEKNRKASSDQQDLLIAELNHRVRNILNLVVGVVRQSKDNAVSVESFADDVSNRVTALARAHDQITATGWNGGSLLKLVTVEANAYLGEKAERIELTGHDVEVTPEAFSTLALVFHELITNAAKYGALRDRRGTVAMELVRMENGDLRIIWTEHNGMPIAARTRRGFGSTIIERAIPHEFGGKADVRLEETGLRAEFLLPARFVSDLEAYSELPEPAQQVAASGDVSLSGRILLVEDNLLIALEAEELLYSLGATEVQIASTVSAALNAIDAEKPSFALLDYNLGKETSLQVAERLSELGVPFAFATGYGDGGGLAQQFPHSPIITKPYAAPAIASAVSATIR